MDCITVVHLDYLLSNIIKNTAKEIPKYWRSRESVVRVTEANGVHKFLPLVQELSGDWSSV